MTIDHGDGLQDNRVTCGECACLAANGNYCRALKMATWRTLPVRCLSFLPLPSDPDQRNGRARWPNYERDLAEVRALDLVHREKQELERA